ncbi:endonuclease/exonuclease/phosphatase family protein [Streptomyces sp. NPDC053367]|uniref:endonuclease/exonuclease/phosphatase family protein n=1 Tax=Streptomyces sp. NPDC053367 TaxID=3365700 RepID=UPI0037D8B604
MLLGTWNLENLYRPGGPFGPEDKPSYETKLAALAAVITELDPALLGVQEVGEPAAFADLVATVGGDWHTVLSKHPDPRGIRVGVLSRTPLRVLADTKAFSARLRPVQGDDRGATAGTAGRGLLAVETDGDAGTLRVAVAHLKSGLLTYPNGRFRPRDEGERARFAAYALFRRAAEAAALRELAGKLLAGDGRVRDVAVLGDLNDGEEAVTTRMLLGPPGSEPTTAGFDRPDRHDGERLWSVAGHIPADERFSRVRAGRRELIDHVLLSRRLIRRVTAAGTGLPAAGPPRLPSVGEDPTRRRGAPGSDHAPVWVRVDD